jgi:hypothetical protein
VVLECEKHATVVRGILFHNVRQQHGGYAESRPTLTVQFEDDVVSYVS